MLDKSTSSSVSFFNSIQFRFDPSKRSLEQLHCSESNNADINTRSIHGARSTGGRLTWLGSLETRPYDISFARWVSRADRCSGRGTHKHVLCNAAGQATLRCVAATQMPKAGEKVWRNSLNNRFYPNRRPSFPLLSPGRGIPRPVLIFINATAVVIVSVVFLIAEDAPPFFFFFFPSSSSSSSSPRLKGARDRYTHTLPGSKILEASGY